MPAHVVSVLAAALLALLTLTVLPTSAHAGVRSCGTIVSDGAPVHVKATRGATCPTARRVLRRYLASRRPCSGSACVRRHHGWTCVSAAAYAGPRLASCSRGRRVIAAYAFAD